MLPGLRGWGLRAVANPAQYVMLAVPDGASDTKLGGVKSRGRWLRQVGEGRGGGESRINDSEAGPGDEIPGG